MRVCLKLAWFTMPAGAPQQALTIGSSTAAHPALQVLGTPFAQDSEISSQHSRLTAADQAVNSDMVVQFFGKRGIVEHVPPFVHGLLSHRSGVHAWHAKGQASSAAKDRPLAALPSAAGWFSCGSHEAAC
eukprot:COSAG05_NODE_11461_length_512_cov_0.929782_1_plen_129_part_10